MIEQEEDTRTEAEKKQAIKDIYNDSVRLLELLNVLIPKIETFGGRVPIEVISEIADKCFELGSNLATNVNEIKEKEEIEEEEDPYNSYFWGC